VSTSKDRIIHLVQLERELRAIPDPELAALIDALPDEFREHLTAWCPAGEPAADHVANLRGAMTRGRLKGMPDRVGEVLSAGCLQDCIAALGDHADHPSVDELRAVVPGLVESHGVRVTRLMMASVVVAEAPATRELLKVLKTEPLLATP
jgi:hypothetical protein